MSPPPAAAPTTESLCAELIAGLGAADTQVAHCVENAREVPLADLEVCVRSEPWTRRLFDEFVNERVGIDSPTPEKVIAGIQHCSQYAGLEALRCAARARDAETAEECLGSLLVVMLRAGLHGSKRPEVVRDLERMAALARSAYDATATFPIGKAGPTPPVPCCEMPAKLCFAAEQDWSGPWRALGYLPQERALVYQYTYDSDGKSLTITGHSDLDCDGTTVTYTLEARVVRGTVETSIRTPTAVD